MLKPKLRFPEFTEEYSPDALFDITDRVRRKNSENQTDIPLTIASIEGLVDQRTYFGKTIASKDMSGYYLLKNGEFAYNKSYSKGYPVGSIKRLDNYEQGALSTLYICFSVKEDADVTSDYLAQYFNSSVWHKTVSEVCAEGARNHGLLNVSPDDFFATVHYFAPTADEQKKISEFLSLYDKKITEQIKIVLALENRRKSLLRQIFTQELRFKRDDGTEYEEWAETEIGTYLAIRNEKQVPTSEAPLKAFVANIGVADKGEKYDRSHLVKDNDKKYKRTELNDFIYSSNNLDVGSIGLNTYGTAVISDVYEIFRIKKDINPTVLNYAIQKRETLNNIILFRQGCLYGQYKIYPEDFLSVEISVPTSTEEQKKIDDFLTLIDEQIQLEKDKLEAIKNVKKGLLQQMFV